MAGVNIRRKIISRRTIWRPLYTSVSLLFVNLAIEFKWEQLNWWCFAYSHCVVDIVCLMSRTIHLRHSFMHPWLKAKVGAYAWRGHSYTRSLFQRSDFVLHFQMQAVQIWVVLETTQNFALFDPLWKLRGKWARSLLLTYQLRPNLWWPSTERLLSTVDW